MPGTIPSFIQRAGRLAKSYLMVALGISLGVSTASGTDLLIHLPDNPSVFRQSIVYQCDSEGSKIGVPPGPFPVEYINGGGNSLVVVPVSGNALIFSNVMSASGARYVTQQYTWWEAKGSVLLFSDSLAGKIQSSCRRVPAARK